MKKLILFSMILIMICSINAWSASSCKGNGGTLTFDGDYCIHTITSNVTFNVTGVINSTILVVAGGGGGGGGGFNAPAGGGGAGGLIYNLSVNISTGSYDATIGGGGNGGLGGGSGKNGVNGENSFFGNYTYNFTAIGGGGGACIRDKNGVTGGSGGGGAQGFLPGAGTAGQGFRGGYYLATYTNFAGGGGGASMNGSNSTSTKSGDGGNGTSYSINGSNVYFAGGGGGASRVVGAGTIGIGGLGGGADGGYDASIPGKNGTLNTGGGGGGSAFLLNGGKGGSGIIIVRYLAEIPLTLAGTISANSNLISSAQIWILDKNGIFLVNATSNSTGGWTANTSNSDLNYTVIGFNPSNISQGGMAYPFEINRTNIPIVLKSSYTPPSYTNVTIVLGASDTTPPNATLISPPNNTITSNVSNNFTVNITDDIGIKNATLNIWNQTSIVNQTTTSFASGVTQSLFGIVVTLVSGTYNWFYTIFDWSNNSYKTGNNTLTISCSPTINTDWIITDAQVCNAVQVTTGTGSIILPQNSNLCYQESANVSTACGGLNTGFYSGDLGANWRDGDWDTQSSSLITSLEGEVSYFKPIGASNTSLWQVKDSAGTVNLTIPNSCWNTYIDKLSFKVVAVVGPDNYAEWYCYNGTWVLLRSLSSDNNIYEEAMIWNISLTGTLTLINGANVTAKGINISGSGDRVFINSKSELKILNPPSVPASLIIRPDGTLRTAQHMTMYPVTGAYFDKINDTIADNYTTYTSSDSSSTTPFDTHINVYSFTNTTQTIGTINNITLTIVAQGDSTYEVIYPYLVFNNISFYGLTTIGGFGCSDCMGGVNFKIFTRNSTNNPNTSVAWNWNDINNLQAGFVYYDESELGVKLTQTFITVNYMS